jgi:hypothetical protein
VLLIVAVLFFVYLLFVHGYVVLSVLLLIVAR